ncbi:hypothetical protein BKA70DRAFT_1226596 [Coprinopsis sp. MPI-PUGE-AT-0042]|nr:hypothetical protein BKA70DRAFT_1226596 [Coprinopsis sp. MPI-PUGE-AT-0042]
MPSSAHAWAEFWLPMSPIEEGRLVGKSYTTIFVLKLCQSGSEFFERPVYDREDKSVQEGTCLENARVQPSDLEEYRRYHELMALCCLCAPMDGVPYTESRITLVAPGSNKAVSLLQEAAVEAMFTWACLQTSAWTNFQCN